MEKCPMRLNTTNQLCQDPMSEKKSRFWQINDQPFPRSEVICPQPRWVTRVPYFMEYCNRVGPNPKGYVFFSNYLETLIPFIFLPVAS